MSKIIYDIAQIDTTPLPLMKLKVDKTMVDHEFAKLQAWKTHEQLVYVHENNMYCLELLLPKSRAHFFNAIMDFEAKTMRVEYAFEVGLCNGGYGIRHPYTFSMLEQIDRTLACWMRFREFIGAIAQD